MISYSFFFFWFISGFNFFLRRYRFGKFTSSIQRFWKRTNMCFWLIEGFLFLIFFYYYLNSSQEPVYAYDTSALNNDFLFSLTVYYFNMLGLVIVIYLLYYTLFKLSTTVYSQQLVFMLIISGLVFYIFLIESYQFYYTISSFKELHWIFNTEENLWQYEAESPRVRVKHQYLLMCLIAKYWHFLFIFISWIFFLMKSFELTKISYTMLSLNLQNFIILFCLNILFLVNWIKWVCRRYLDLIYFWFFSNTNFKWLSMLTQEIFLLVSSLFLCS